MLGNNNIMLKSVHFCFDLHWKYHNFERNKISATVFLKWMDFRETLSSLTRNWIASTPTSTDIGQPSHESSNHISSIFETLSGMRKMLTLQVTMGINMLFTKTSQSIVCDLQNFERVYVFLCGLMSPFFGCTETANQKLNLWTLIFF